jgi:thioredoxin 1
LTKKDTTTDRLPLITSNNSSDERHEIDQDNKMLLSTHRLVLFLTLALCALASAAHRPSLWGTTPVSLWKVRGGEQAATETVATEQEEGTDGLSLDQKVKNAMEKLGLKSPPSGEGEQTEGEECEGGVCEMPSAEAGETAAAPTSRESAHVMAARIATDMGVNQDLALAALGATGEVNPGSERKLDEQAARALIQQELDIIANTPEDSESVQTLVSEGHEIFLARRALAFADGSMEDARAILLADQMDAEEEEKYEEAARKAAEEEDTEATVRAQLRDEAAAKQKVSPVKSLSVNFDPAAGNLPAPTPPKPAAGGMKPPPPAKREDVIFEATTAQLQELVLESPVPVLLDTYAPWCGPCKALTPILEEMAINAGGVFRLVKVNTDNEKAISSALEVTALPTIFAVRDGKILNNFQGMPRSEEMMKNFMMGLLMPGATFNPPVTQEMKENFAELSSKLAKTAGAAGFSFSTRERLQTRMATQLDALVEAYDGNMADAEDSAKVVRSLLSNVIRDPFETKFRRINLENKKIASLVAAYAPCLAMLKSVGFGMESSGTSMMVGKGKTVVNVSPLTVARDCIDKWIDKNRHKVAAALRKRKDEEARAELAAEAADASDYEEEEEEEEEIDPNAVTLKVRLEGKKKVHELELNAEDSLSKVIEALPASAGEEDYQITCVAKKLIVKSTDSATLSKSLQSLGLTPTAALVVKIGSTTKADSSASSSLKERVAAQKSLKKGSHTMQSIGVYAKDDHLKGELIDGGGGVMYEQDVTDDEEEGTENTEEEEDDSDKQEE